MMIDFALAAEREGMNAAAGSHLSGLPAALPSDSDDHPRRPAWRAALDAQYRRRRLRRPLEVGMVGGLMLSQWY